MKHYRFTVGYHAGSEGFVVIFTRCRHCTEETADIYLDKLLARFPGTCGGWEVLPR